MLIHHLTRPFLCIALLIWAHHLSAQGEVANEVLAGEMAAKTVVKITELEKTLLTVTLPTATDGQVNHAVESAVSLFAGEDNEIEVKLYKSGSQSYLVRDYFLMLRDLIVSGRYKKITFEWTEINVETFKKNSQGQWEASVTIRQYFEGTTLDKKKESSWVDKMIQVVIEEKKKIYNGQEVIHLEVKLGNIMLREIQQK